MVSKVTEKEKSFLGSKPAPSCGGGGGGGREEAEWVGWR